MPKKFFPTNTPQYLGWLKAQGTAPAASPDAGGTPVGLTFTTTLSALTSHNISDSANYNKANFPTLFTGTSNKDGVNFTVNSTLMDDSQNAAAPLNISKVSMKKLMPAGWTGKIINHFQGWWGNPSHPNIGYSDTNASDMARIMADSGSRGYDVVVLDYYGITVTGAGNDAVADLIAANAPQTGQTFAIMIDSGYFAKNGVVAANYQSSLVSIINHLASRYFNNPAYEHYTLNGVKRPLLLLWNVANFAGTNINWTTLKTQITGNPLLIQYQKGGFTVAASDGAFAWVDTTADTNTGVTSGTTYLSNGFLPACTTHQSQVCISSALKGFNGTLTKSTAWSLGKFLDQQNGQTWLDWWSTNSSYVSGGHRLDYIGVVTFDDFQEGTAVQAGILNDIVFTSAQISGSTLTWAVSGNENTVFSYEIYITPDGSNMAHLATILPGQSKSVDLSSLSIPSGNYSVYVQAQGQPCIVNHLSSPMPYTR